MVQWPSDGGREKSGHPQEHNKKLDRFRRNEFPNNHFLLNRCLKIVPMHDAREGNRSNFQSRVYRQFNLLFYFSLNTRSKSIFHIFEYKKLLLTIHQIFYSRYTYQQRSINNTYNRLLFSSVSNIRIR